MLIARFFDLENLAPKDEIELYAEHCRKAKGPILEAMCGTGRILAPLREMGLPVEGFDASEQMLARAREKTDAPLYLQRIETLSLPKQYSLIYVPDRSLSIFREPPLRKLREFLLPNGALVFDLWNSMHPAPHRICEKKQFGNLYSEKTYLYTDGVFEVSHRFRENGVEENEAYKIHFFEPEEIRALCKQAGFSLENFAEETHLTMQDGHVYQLKSSRILAR